MFRNQIGNELLCVFPPSGVTTPVALLWLGVLCSQASQHQPCCLLKLQMWPILAMLSHSAGALTWIPCYAILILSLGFYYILDTIHCLLDGLFSIAVALATPGV